MPMTPSMRADNHYTFLCPMAQRQERYLACMLRRHKHWRGEAIEADCATCMNAGKCPALKMLDREWREEKAIYLDLVPGRVRKLPADIEKLVENKVVTTSSAYGTGISRARLEQLMEQKISDKAFHGVENNVLYMGGTEDAPASGPASHARVQKGNAADGRAERQKLAAARPKPVRAAPESLADAVASVDTDMASAINEAMRGEAA